MDVAVSSPEESGGRIPSCSGNLSVSLKAFNQLDEAYTHHEVDFLYSKSTGVNLKEYPHGGDEM